MTVTLKTIFLCVLCSNILVDVIKIDRCIMWHAMLGINFAGHIISNVNATYFISIYVFNELVQVGFGEFPFFAMEVFSLTMFDFKLLDGIFKFIRGLWWLSISHGVDFWISGYACIRDCTLDHIQQCHVLGKPTEVHSLGLLIAIRTFNNDLICICLLALGFNTVHA